MEGLEALVEKQRDAILPLSQNVSLRPLLMLVCGLDKRCSGLNRGVCCRSTTNMFFVRT